MNLSNGSYITINNVIFKTHYFYAKSLLINYSCLSKQMSAQTKGMIPSGQKMPDGTERRMALVFLD
jgi:hypothetical protein